jgi:hypothetical protein
MEVSEPGNMQGLALFEEGKNSAANDTELGKKAVHT